jgi:hypothetical protein
LVTHKELDILWVLMIVITKAIGIVIPEVTAVVLEVRWQWFPIERVCSVYIFTFKLENAAELRLIKTQKTDLWLIHTWVHRESPPPGWLQVANIKSLMINEINEAIMCQRKLWWASRT